MFRLSFLWSASFLLNARILWLLFWVNLLGTLYGYEWYRNQLVFTWKELGPWLVWFVPDSPTASLFFTITLWLLLRDLRSQTSTKKRIQPTHAALWSWRGLIEALAVVTQVKYGIWAVLMIFWGAAQGDTIVWQQWMLVVSHTCMAIEALLYMRFYRFTVISVAAAALWTLLNDTIDYTFGVFPWLPQPLLDDLSAIQSVTVALSALGIACAYIGVGLARKNRV